MMHSLKKNELIVFSLLLLLTIGVFFLPQMQQYAHYHNFGDQRTLCHIPHFWNIMSNIPFAWVGALGIYAAHRNITDKTEKFFALLCFWATTSLVITSSYYHFEPNNFGVFIDRISIVFAIIGLIGLVTIRHISPLSGIITSIIAAIFGLGGLYYWYITAGTPSEDLRFYALVQILPMLLFPVILWISSKDKGKKYIIACLAWYGIAKLCETYDIEIYALLFHTISGHSLKHIAAAIGGYMIVKYVNTKPTAS